MFDQRQGVVDIIKMLYVTQLIHKGYIFIHFTPPSTYDPWFKGLCGGDSPKELQQRQQADKVRVGAIARGRTSVKARRIFLYFFYFL